MDKFTKYTLILMAIIVAAMIVAAYIGVFVVGGDMETAYISIIEEEAEKLGLSFGHPIELDETGEYMGFTVAGAISGFIIGYMIPTIFEKPKNKGGNRNA
ncbi:MAG: hypothetical protein QXT06_08465 [Candidatus Bathyarchaeia archaeon]